MKNRRKKHSLLTHDLNAEERLIKQALLELSSLGLSYGELSKLLGNIDPNTVRRWASGESLARFTQFSKIQKLQEIMELAHRVFGDEAKVWFNEPNPAIGNILPLTLIRDPVNGPELVRRLLVSALSGAVA